MSSAPCVCERSKITRRLNTATPAIDVGDVLPQTRLEISPLIRMHDGLKVLLISWRHFSPDLMCLINSQRVVHAFVVEEGILIPPMWDAGDILQPVNNAGKRIGFNVSE